MPGYKIYGIVIILFSFLKTSAQDLPYARQVVDTLCSPTMKGRGYVDNGGRLAANYIAAEFKRLGLKKFGKDYFQKFATPVNSFPGKMEVAINGKKIIAGKDYLVDAGSPGISGDFAVQSLTALDLLDEKVWIPKVKSAIGKWIVVESYDKKDFDKDQLKKVGDIIAFLQYNSENPAAGTIIITKDKLTWGGSTQQFSKPGLIIKEEAIQLPVNLVTLDIENKFFKEYKSQNIVGYIEGVKKDSFLVLTAHYDHLGMMGSEAMFPGANDNASGVAFLLNIASYYSRHSPERTIVFIAFGGEEIGLVGSQYFVQNPLFPLSKIKFLVNFDISGTGDDGIQIVNGKIYQSYFDRITAINNEHNLLKEIKIRGEACNSDHCMFYKKGVPCFFIYTLGGIQAYHDIYDKAATLPLTEFEDYFKLMVEFLNEI